MIVDFGTHIQRIGLQTSAFATVSQHEFAFEYQVYFNLKNLGHEKTYWENTFRASYKFGFGEEDLFYLANPYFHPSIDHLSEKYAIGYALNFYLNKVGTKQSTGTIGFYVDDWNINLENDLWGNTKGRDRFRTGNLSITLIQNEFLFSASSLLWTGETKCAEAVKVDDANDYPARYGYKDISACPFGKYSHGIVQATIAYVPEDFFRQQFALSVGLDAERIRNFIQNKVIHDMYFLPEKVSKAKNLHVPMLDENGMPYLYRNDQQIRKAKFYFQASANGTFSY